MSPRSSRLALLFCGCLWVPHVSARPGDPPVEDIDYAGATDAQARSFNRLITDVLWRHGSLLDAYVAINALPVATDLTVHRNENQLAAMLDTFVGRYDDATTRMRANSYDSAGEVPVACPAFPWRRQDAVEWAAHGLADTRVVLFNEAHNLPLTRALLYRLLPVLRAQGFDTLAMETLRSGKKAGTLADTALVERGYPLDSLDTGVYVREPIDGELLREARRLGFRLVAYDSDEAGPAREAAQAANLAAVLAAQPRMRMIVIAGYAHITRTWMAGHLRPLVAGKVVAIDQIDALGGCNQQTVPKGDMGNRPYVYAQANGLVWAMRPDAYEISVVTPPRLEATGARPRWLDLGGARKRVPVSRKLCEGEDPCLFEARYDGESEQAVPADRYLYKRGDSRPALWLRPGSYTLKVSGRDAATIGTSPIAVEP
ncbi:MAG TPA: hypothetical protein VGO76_09730 [Luteibacter sp.]|jgi:hypothetical protein|nr:hypothetical protein [Luteibacter sp.]